MKIMSVPRDHCESHNNSLKIFSKNYTLYGVHIFYNSDIRLNLRTFNDTKTHFREELLFWFKFYKSIGKSNKVRSLLLN